MWRGHFLTRLAQQIAISGRSGPPADGAQMCRENARIIGGSGTNILPAVIIQDSRAYLGIPDDFERLALCIIGNAGQLECLQVRGIAVEEPGEAILPVGRLTAILRESIAYYKREEAELRKKSPPHLGASAVIDPPAGR